MNYFWIQARTQPANMVFYIGLAKKCHTMKTHYVLHLKKKKSVYNFLQKQQYSFSQYCFFPEMLLQQGDDPIPAQRSAHFFVEKK